MLNFIKRILFIILIFPFGLLLSFEICIRLFISVIKWVFIGNFDEDFTMNSFFANTFIKITEQK